MPAAEELPKKNPQTARDERKAYFKVSQLTEVAF